MKIAAKWVSVFCLFLGINAWASEHQTEMLLPANISSVADQGILYVESVSPVQGSSDLFNAQIVLNLVNTIPNVYGITVDCTNQSLRTNWKEPQREMMGSFSFVMRTNERAPFVVPAQGSVEEVAVQRICELGQALTP